MSFTQEAVQLERRDGPEWRSLGQARFSGDDLASVLSALRDQAGGKWGELDTVLVIPDDQVLYTTLTVPFGSDTPATIARALEASTPYRAQDLTFDWCPAVNGDIETLRVAAVARRTLQEAEDFARAQGFRPSGFQARPNDDRFDGQPDFGTSRLAQEQFDRRPFSDPDLSQARVTAPFIEPEVAATVQAPAAVTVSRITAHVVEPQAAASADPVARPPLAATAVDAASPVIRHGQVAPLTAQRLSPRAEAVHNRAAAARANRPHPEPEAGATRTALMARLAKLDLARLPVLVGGLAVMLALVLLFLGGEPQTETQPKVETAALTPDPVIEPAPQVVEPTPEPEATLPNALPPIEMPAPIGEGVVQEQADAPEAEAETPTTELPVVEAPAPETAEEELDPLTRALAEAVAANPEPETPVSAPQPTPQQIAAATLVQRQLPVQTPPAAVEATPAPLTPAPAVTATAPAATPRAQPAPVNRRVNLDSSARPPRTTPARASAPAAPENKPRVPTNPLPFEDSTRSAAPRVTSIRPPDRPTQTASRSEAPARQPAAARAARPSAAPAARPAAPTATTSPTVGSSRPPSTTRPATSEAPAAAPAPAQSSVAPSTTSRPPSRPQDLSLLEEGSASEDDAPVQLTQAERHLLEQQLRDLRTAQAGQSGFTPAERGLVFQLADARPTRKPMSVRGPSQQAVQSAVAEAVGSGRPETKTVPKPAVQATSSGAISRSARPDAKPRNAASASLSSAAVDRAVASAIDTAPAAGSVALTSLRSSATPPRRSARAVAAATSNAMVATAAPVAAAIAPAAADQRAAAAEQAAAAAQAEQRRQDDELQAQAEARARNMAAADARAEAQARAAAEARARAQAEAEARAAASRNQRYQPPEVDAEPDVVAAIPQGSSGTAASSATVKDGIRLNSTQIIGTIGAGQASRALVRLSNGRVLTLRIGDRINGGTISAIGDSRITYQKGGKAYALGILNGQ
ncbi:hypothetical protein [Paracoccus sp. JM45]|uniref:hypothetical protein n=1 Tax=Paracoccus sp. JM45 TaxID=2283626 RepID=UPI000E6C6377|nr:hypothetical protein [Paracoccus sp. JM45]RJE80183.1 hypothetical protein DWB67_08290 [Paracoccus sp. JM45]